MLSIFTDNFPEAGCSTGHDFYRSHSVSVQFNTIFFARYTALLTCLALWSSVSVHAHGGVFLEDDQCVIQIGFYKAHFKIYQHRKASMQSSVKTYLI